MAQPPCERLPGDQRFFEVSADLLLVIDSEGQILRANPAWGRVLDWPPEALERQLYERFVHPAELAIVEPRLRALVGTNEQASFTCRWRRQDGTFVWLSWSVSASSQDGALYGAARPLEPPSLEAIEATQPWRMNDDLPLGLYLKDITERRRTEEALRRSELSFRKLIEGVPDGICVHRDERFVYVNPALLAALGYERESDLLGRSIRDIIHPDDLERVRRRVQSIIATGKPAPPQELRSLRRDGTWFYSETVAMTLEFDGAPSVLVVGRDITERKQLQAQLLQADRMATIGTLSAGVGHEINNPLTYVLSNLSLAGEEVARLAHELEQAAPALAREQGWRSQLEELREMLLEAHMGADRVRTIVRDLKIFSRQGQEQRSVVDVREVLDFSLKMSQHELRSRARIVKQYEPVPAVYADASRLGQVFLNLLVNAAQAIPEGRAEESEIALRVRRDGSGRVAVEVSDTGAGIPPEVLPRIFDPFFTTRPVGSGTGLGLSICHGIIQGLGGEITVRSELGRGTTFTLLFPPHVPAPVASKPTPVPLPTSRRGHVLVIDDEPGLGRAVARMIGGAHAVTVVQSGYEALAQLTSGGPFDAIFCDLMMADISGMDLYERMRELRPGLLGRFVFMTGGAFTPRARAFLEQVPNGRLEKPFDAQQLLRLLRMVLREHPLSSDTAGSAR